MDNSKPLTFGRVVIEPGTGRMTREHELGDAPIERVYEVEMELIARTLDRIFNGEARGPDRSTGFVLLIFPFGSNEGRCNYISNGTDRAEVSRLLKDQAAKFDADIAKAAKCQ